MMNLPPFPDSQDHKMIARGWRVLGGLIARLVHCPSVMTARRLLLVGESIARRLIFIMAMLRPTLAPKPPAASPLKPDIFVGKADLAENVQIVGTPRFRLCETIRSVFFELSEAEETTAEPTTPPPQTDARSCEDWIVAMARAQARIARRVAALESVIDAPDRQVERLRRWMAREAGWRQAGARARAAPITSWRTPGLKQFDALNPTRLPPSEEQWVLSDLAWLARRAGLP